jgi:anti-sigma factor RsiW
LMMRAVRPVVCERVRAQVSLVLDGELSELERRMMESHLARCGECSAFEQEAAAITRLLHEAPLEPIPYPFVVRRPRRAAFPAVQIGAAAAFAVAVLGAAVQLTGIGAPTPSALPSLQIPAHYETRDQLTREVHQIALDGRAYDRRSEDGRSALSI